MQARGGGGRAKEAAEGLERSEFKRHLRNGVGMRKSVPITWEM